MDQQPAQIEAKFVINSDTALDRKPPNGPTIMDHETQTAPLSAASLIRKKREAGDQLTDDQASVLTQYYAKYAAQKLGIHVKKGRAEDWREKSRLQGVSLSAWVQERVIEALSGPGPLVDDLRTENQSLRDEVHGLQGASGALAVKNSELETRLASLEESLMDAIRTFDPELTEMYGEAIQLLNWARLLHDVTDRKGTWHVEGEILRALMNANLVQHSVDEILAMQPSASVREELVGYRAEVESDGGDEEWDASIREIQASADSWKRFQTRRLIQLANHAYGWGDQERGRQALDAAIVCKNVSSDIYRDDYALWAELAEQHAPDLAKQILPKDEDSEGDDWKPESLVGQAVHAGAGAAEWSQFKSTHFVDGIIELHGSRSELDRTNALALLATLAEIDEELAWQTTYRILKDQAKISRGWGSGFKSLCQAMTNVDKQKTLETALQAWRDERVLGRPYGHGTIDNMCYLVLSTRGKLAARELIEDAMQLLSRSLSPFQHRIQFWGRLQESWQT